jgi:hypothetical protein
VGVKYGEIIGGKETQFVGYVVIVWQNRICGRCTGNFDVMPEPVPNTTRIILKAQFFSYVTLRHGVNYYRRSEKPQSHHR